jgi:hypothetical protein
MLVIAVSVPLSQAFSEAPTVEWNKTYSDLYANSVIQTADGGYAIVGYAGSIPSDNIILSPSFFSFFYTNQTAMLVYGFRVYVIQQKRLSRQNGF